MSDKPFSFKQCQHGPTIKYYMVILLIVIGFTVRKVLRWQNTRYAITHLSQFTPVQDLNCYEESRPRFFAGPVKPFSQAVLLLHGYSASPSEFEKLLVRLEETGTPYYAPLMTGFGLNDFRLLYKIDQSDWLRDAKSGYELLSSLADRVSIVGQSNGSNLAIYVASKYPVEHLILVGPNLAPTSRDRWRKRVLTQPILSNVALLLYPVFAKPVRLGRNYPADTLDPVSARQGFSYYALPTHSLKEVWKLQDKVHISEAKFKQLTIIYGEHDLTVDNGATLQFLRENNIPFTSRSFPNTAHNVFQDYDSAEAVDYVMNLLSQ